MKIREASMQDADFAVSMMESLHKENEAKGGIVRQGERTTTWIRTIVGEAIARGKGLVLIAEDGFGDNIGALVAVDTELPYDSDYTKMIAGIGTAVVDHARENGVASELYKAASELLSNRGYDAYLGAYLTNNSKARRAVGRAGFVPFEVSVLMDLGD